MWPAVTIGLPGKPTIISAAGSKDTITLVVEQAADATATSFELAVFDASGAAVSPTYTAPLLSVGSRSNGRQTVVFGTDSSKLGGTYRFKVGSGAARAAGCRGCSTVLQSCLGQP